jgi:hypothetical protein
VCADLPTSVATQITGTKLTSAKPSSTMGVIFECEYHGPNYALLQVSVATTGGQADYSGDVSALSAVGHKPNSVSGVGDKAFSMPDPNENAGSAGAAGFASYGALFGDTYIKIGGLTYVSPSQGKQIAERLPARSDLTMLRPQSPSRPVSPAPPARVQQALTQQPARPGTTSSPSPAPHPPPAGLPHCPRPFPS